MYGSVQTLNMPHHSFKRISEECCKELENYCYIQSVQIDNGGKTETWDQYHGLNKNLKNGEKEEFYLEIDFKYPKTNIKNIQIFH